MVGLGVLVAVCFGVRVAFTVVAVGLATAVDVGLGVGLAGMTASSRG